MGLWILAFLLRAIGSYLRVKVELSQGCESSSLADLSSLALCKDDVGPSMGNSIRYNGLKKNTHRALKIKSVFQI